MLLKGYGIKCRGGVDENKWGKEKLVQTLFTNWTTWETKGNVTRKL
jgi:hypothetical protein